MTYEEFKEKFPVGSFIKACDCVGTVLEYSDSCEYVCLSISDNKAAWIPFNYLNFKLSAELEYPDSNIVVNCPRCSSEMIKKQTDQYGLIDKCSNCGYC